MFFVRKCLSMCCTYHSASLVSTLSTRFSTASSACLKKGYPSQEAARSFGCCERACKGTECARDTSLPSIITEFVKANHIYYVTLGEVSIHIVSSIPNPHASHLHLFIAILLLALFVRATFLEYFVYSVYSFTICNNNKHQLRHPMHPESINLLILNLLLPLLRFEVHPKVPTKALATARPETSRLATAVATCSCMRSYAPRGSTKEKHYSPSTDWGLPESQTVGAAGIATFAG